LSAAAGPAGLSAEQLLELARALLVKRDDLLRRACRLLADGDTSAEVRDGGDVASAEDGMRLRARLGEREWTLLREVERALVKIRDGSYGTCEGTGQPIGYARLAVRPWSLYSVAGQEARECPPARRGTHPRRAASTHAAQPGRSASTENCRALASPPGDRACATSPGRDRRPS